jgi:hypothetical protein
MNKRRPWKDFGEAVGIHHAVDHLAALTVFDEMPFDESDCEASEPTEIVSEGPFAGAAVVLPEVDSQNPRHGVDSPVATDGFTKPLARKATVQDVEPGLCGFGSIGLLRDSYRIANCREPWPLFSGTEIDRNLDHAIWTFTNPTLAFIEGGLDAVTQILQILIDLLVKGGGPKEGKRGQVYMPITMEDSSRCGGLVRRGEGR